jgi:hypothetical protein
MWITPNQWGSRLPIERLTSGAVSCLTNVIRQNSWGDVWADKPATRNCGRRLIYRDVNFVKERFRAVLCGIAETNATLASKNRMNVQSARITASPPRMR